VAEGQQWLGTGSALARRVRRAFISDVPTPILTDEALTLYADYVCPFCCLGRTSLQRYRAECETPLGVEWHPFDLRADRRGGSGEIVRESWKDDTYDEEAWRNVERLAEEFGVGVPEDPITDVDSIRAQQVSLFVRESHPETWTAFDAALYDALWQDERDIGDPDLLADVADEVGLEAGIVDRALAKEELGSGLGERFTAARRRGITGVPTFVHGDHAARGAVPPDRIRRLVEGSG